MSQQLPIEEKNLTKKEAIAMLPAKKKLHSYESFFGAAMGCNISRESALKKIDNSINLSTSNKFAFMNHNLKVEYTDDDGNTRCEYLETKVGKKPKS